MAAASRRPGPPRPGLRFDTAGEVRDFFFAVLEGLPHAIILADPQGRVLVANGRARTLLADDILDRSCWELLASRLGVRPEALAPLAAGAGALTVSLDAPAAGGRRHLAISRHDLKSPFWRVAGFCLVLDDVTLSWLAGIQADRERRLAAMAEMAGAIAQDLKNPLGSLALYASLLRRELAADPDLAPLVDRMQQALRSMDRLCDTYQAAASLPELRPTAVPVADWLAEAAAELAAVTASRPVAVSLELGHTTPLILADRELLSQLALNLLLNAVQAMPAGGRIQIASRTLPGGPRGASWLEVAFRDSGHGIAPEHLGRIFDPFFTTRKKAAGLGLALVHRIVEAHQGLIEVDSSPAGSTFRILLPAPNPMTASFEQHG
ncbi:MAG: ATP-binding protein [Thermodesulfobacteriota bacterium]